MTTKKSDYSLFYEFIEQYMPDGFSCINESDELLIDLEQQMEANNQFLYVADMVKLKIVYTSKRSFDMVGVESANFDLSVLMDATHPDDIHRFCFGRSKLIKLGHDLFISKSNNVLLSTTFKVKNPSGNYSNLIFQNFLFYTTVPHETVFMIKLHTNIDWSKSIKDGFHYYLGTDLSNFRYPDKELLELGNRFSKRELEIIKLIENGCSTKEIASKLFVSPYTINTHRRNIIIKSKNSKISEIIAEFKDNGYI